MKLFIIKCLVILALVLGAATILDTWKDSAKPVVSNKLAINQVNGGDTDWIAMRTFERQQKAITIAVWVVVLLSIVGLLAPDIRRLITEDNSNRNPES